MAHGHVSIVLGVQTGFTSIIHRIEAFRRQSTGNTGESVSYQDTYNTDELMTVLKHFKCVVEALVQNNIGMTITA